MKVFGRTWIITSMGLVASGCTTFANPEKLQHEMRVSDVPAGPILYANLEKPANKKWRFAGINPDAGQVRLNDMWVNIDEPRSASRGMIGLLPATHIQSSSKMRPFNQPLYGFSVDPLTVITTPVSAIYAIAAPLGLLMEGPFAGGSVFLPVYGTHGPSQSAHRKALAQAKATDAVDRRLPELVSRYAEVKKRIRALQDDAVKIENDLQGGTLSSLSAWNEQSIAVARHGIQVRLINNTGWPFTIDADAMRARLSLETSAPAWKAPELSIDSVQDQIFPANDLDDLELRLKGSEGNLAAATNQLLQRARVVAGAHAERRKVLARLDAKVKVDDDFLRESLAGWAYSIDAPKSLDVSGGVLASPACYCLMLLGREFSRVTPSSFKAEDRIVSAEWMPTGIRITNKTNNYLTIDAVTVYYEGTAKTVGGEDFSNHRELPPGTDAFISSPFTRDDAIDMTLTREEAIRRTLRFGLALKYRTTHDSVPRSLARRENLPLMALISEN